jgi:hypothetical protein
LGRGNVVVVTALPGGSVGVGVEKAANDLDAGTSESEVLSIPKKSTETVTASAAKEPSMVDHERPLGSGASPMIQVHHSL